MRNGIIRISRTSQSFTSRSIVRTVCMPCSGSTTAESRKRSPYFAAASAIGAGLAASMVSSPARTPAASIMPTIWSSGVP
jgi:hypothetical protein